jgi:hypothetical protein
MASNYGMNFGFRRSDETVRVAEGRFKTPATGAALLLGTAVQIDTANAGFVTACAANAALVTGFSGILLQEEIFIRPIYEQQILDTYNLGVARLNKLSVISSGSGTKIWLKNTASLQQVDDRPLIPAVTIWTPAGVGVGDHLGWTGTAWAKTTTAVQMWMTVTFLTTDGLGCEAVMSA